MVVQLESMGVMSGVRRRVEEGRESHFGAVVVGELGWYLEEAGDDGNRARTPQQRDSGSSWGEIARAKLVS
jgi:hypothetical protein